MLVIGHRGVPSLEPENTIRSFKKAQGLGADMIELDVRLSKDGQPVVFHDHNLRRIFSVRKNISGVSLPELKTISAAREIPTLDEVLDAIRVPLIIDIKVRGLEKQIIENLKGFTAKVLISSTYPSVLEKIRALDGKVNLGLIIGRGEMHLLPLISRLTKKLNLYSIHPSYTLTNSKTVKKFKAIGKKVFVWTVNSRSEYEKMSKLGVDGIFTDNTQLFAK